MKKYVKVITGCLIIALAMNLFFTNFNLIPAGLFGFSVLYNFKTGFSMAVALLLANLFCIIFGKIFFSFKKLKQAILPSVLIPLFIFLTSFFIDKIDLSGAEMMLISIYGGFIIGFGMKLIYAEGYKASGFDIFIEVIKLIFEQNYVICFYVIDFLWLLISYYTFGLEMTMYSLISIILMEVIRYRAIIGVGNSKVFYIITKEEKKVKEYMMKELNLKITLFDVKGGFSKNKNTVLMSVVPSADYYKIREGIKNIDNEAFVSITDTYESINSKLRK